MLLLLLALQANPVQQDSIPAVDSLPRITLAEALRRSTRLDPDYVQAPTSGATRSSTSEKSCRRLRRQARGRQHDRLQRARRAHGLAAFGAATPDQSAAGRTRRAGGRHGGEGLRRQGAEGRHAEDELRGSRPSGQLAAQHVRVALQHPGFLRQGPRVFPQASAGHQPRRAGQGPGRGRKPSRSKWCGTSRRPRASSTCWSRSTSA